MASGVGETGHELAIVKAPVLDRVIDDIKMFPPELFVSVKTFGTLCP